MYDFGLVIISWLTFLVVWTVTSFGVKRDVTHRTLGSWLVFLFWRVVLIAGIVLLVRLSGNAATIVDSLAFLPGPLVGWVGAILTALGIAIAIWARVYLGRNWSSHPTQKEDHELVTGGPYQYVRHPIYTGMLLALFGSAMTGFVFSIAAFAFFVIFFVIRVYREERIMLGLFPDQYPAYQARTKKLIPFVW